VLEAMQQQPLYKNFQIEIKDQKISELEKTQSELQFDLQARSELDAKAPFDDVFKPQIEIEPLELQNKTLLLQNNQLQDQIYKLQENTNQFQLETNQYKFDVKELTTKLTKVSKDSQTKDDEISYIKQKITSNEIDIRNLNDKLSFLESSQKTIHLEQEDSLIQPDSHLKEFNGYKSKVSLSEKKNFRS
jgi:chromosome segregation ATPase